MLKVIQFFKDVLTFVHALHDNLSMRLDLCYSPGWYRQTAVSFSREEETIR
jgi:hypothetical protein